MDYSTELVPQNPVSECFLVPPPVWGIGSRQSRLQKHFLGGFKFGGVPEMVKRSRRDPTQTIIPVTPQHVPKRVVLQSLLSPKRA